ncbi:MAG: hypothetical protein Q9178_001352 [Gyalolechia marmorata]
MAPDGHLIGLDTSAEEMDDIHHYTVDMQKVFRDVDVNMDAPIERQAAQLEPKDSGDALGVEKEVQVRSKRQPVAKLDEDRLLSQAGIPKLRRIAKERFRFKGKGHEYSDLARLLKIYQLWLDDLYPRAKFADGLAMIEKLGHKKRIQIMRREWIHEGKPREKYNDMDAPKGAEGVFRPDSKPKNHVTVVDNDRIDKTPGTKQMSNLHNEDLSGGFPDLDKTVNDGSETLFLSNDAFDNQTPEDDLDALLAESTDDNEGRQLVLSNTPRRHEDFPQDREDNFDDDLEALAEIGD